MTRTGRIFRNSIHLWNRPHQFSSTHTIILNFKIPLRVQMFKKRYSNRQKFDLKFLILTPTAIAVLFNIMYQLTVSII